MAWIILRRGEPIIDEITGVWSHWPTDYDPKQAATGRDRYYFTTEADDGLGRASVYSVSRQWVERWLARPIATPDVSKGAILLRIEEQALASLQYLADDAARRKVTDWPIDPHRLAQRVFAYGAARAARIQYEQEQRARLLAVIEAQIAALLEAARSAETPATPGQSGLA